MSAVFLLKKISNYSFKTLARIEKYARLRTNKKKTLDMKFLKRADSAVFLLKTY